MAKLHGSSCDLQLVVMALLCILFITHDVEAQVGIGVGGGVGGGCDGGIGVQQESAGVGGASVSSPPGLVLCAVPPTCCSCPPISNCKKYCLSRGCPIAISLPTIPWCRCYKKSSPPSPWIP